MAIETVNGSLAGRQGGFALLQRGLMGADGMTLEYTIAPGSGTGDLAGITGTLDLDASNDHAWELSYQLPD